MTLKMILTLLLIELLLCTIATCSWSQDVSSPLKKPMSQVWRNKELILTPQRTFYRDLIPSWAIVGHPLLKLPEESVRKLLVILRDTEPAIFAELAESELYDDQSFATPPPDESWVVSRVKNMEEHQKHLRNETDDFMHHYQYYYSHLALDEADTDITKESAVKYGISFIFRFLLEFYMLYRKALDININSSRLKRLIAIDDHGASYNKALQIVQRKKRETPLQITASVKRAADMFKSIVNESVKIIQSNSDLLSRSWECAAFHIASLATQASNCSSVWYQAFVHLVVLGSKYSFDETFATKIADIDMLQDVINFDDIFDDIIDKLAICRDVVCSQLSEVGNVFDTIAVLQSKGLLHCASFENIYTFY